MYIRNLTLKNVKLMRELTLDFTRNGEPRMWTVLLGENGTCKTTILQAIAMAASGPSLANRLASSGRADLSRSLRRRETRDETRIISQFTFAEGGHEGYEIHRIRPDDPAKRGERFSPREYPEWRGEPPARAPVLHSQLYQMSGQHRISGISWYEGQEPRAARPLEQDPLEILRGREWIVAHWFVAGYGVDRNLPQPEGTIGRSGVQERLQSLFGNHAISATRFVDHFVLTENDELADAFGKTLRSVVKKTNALLPGVLDIKLRSESPESRRDPIERHQVQETIGDTRSLLLPTVWMSQGYQSSIAWIADLVGQVLLEAQLGVPPEHMEGLVLIDEIDLHLHPRWQVGLIEALKDIFPKLQFVVTTHSPLVITGCEPDEVIRLERRDGEVTQVDTPAPSPRTMTGTELYWNYFALDQLIPNARGQALYDYERLARNGARTEEEEARLERLRKKLSDLGLEPDIPVMPRDTGS